jgi:hypothetical protein
MHQHIGTLGAGGSVCSITVECSKSASIYEEICTARFQKSEWNTPLFHTMNSLISPGRYALMKSLRTNSPSYFHRRILAAICVVQSGKARHPCADGRWTLQTQSQARGQPLGDRYPIPARLYGLSQCFLFAVQSGCFQYLDIQVPTIQTEKSIRLK